VPQPTAPPRAPIYSLIYIFRFFFNHVQANANVRMLIISVGNFVSCALPVRESKSTVARPACVIYAPVPESITPGKNKTGIVSTSEFLV
jgi:hypothetical protein